jgi:phage major head subunit gpT-like protein
VELTPLFVYDFQRNLQLRFDEGVKRAIKKLWWTEVAITQPSDSLQELYEWMLETAQIRDTGSKGDQIDFEDLVALSWSITNKNAGDALTLDRNEFEDNRYSRAAKWASDVGNQGLLWPQRQIVAAILAGETQNGYDGVPFFSASHPVNPYDSSVGLYSNLITDLSGFGGTSTCELSAANIAAAQAVINTVIGPWGIPRELEAEIILAAPANRLAAQVATGAEVITDPLPGRTSPANQTGYAGVTNVIKRDYGFGQPIIAAQLSTAAGGNDDHWYMLVKAEEDALNGAFIYQERKAWELNSFTGLTQDELNRLNVFNWELRGRNVSAYGHPYLAFKIKASVLDGKKWVEQQGELIPPSLRNRAAKIRPAHRAAFIELLAAGSL